MPSEKRVFTGFDELAQYLRGTLDKGIESVEKGRIKPLGAPSKGERFEGHITAAHESIAAKRYKDADDHAWAAMRLSGLSDKEDVVGRTPSQLLEETPSWERKYLSAALTIIGASYRNRERHFDAVRFLERAVELDPSNAYAMRNLSDLCTKASPRALQEDTPLYGQEIDRETELGIDVTAKLLKLLGVDEKNVSGKRPIGALEGDRKVNVGWALNNMASLQYRRGRHQIHNLKDGQGGRASLGKAVEYATTTLEILGLGRDVSAASDSGGVESLDRQRMTAARALTFIGSCKRMLEDEAGAYRAYEAALKIQPDLKEAADNIQRLKPPKSVAENPPKEAEAMVKPAPSSETMDWWAVRAHAELDVKPQVGDVNLSDVTLNVVDAAAAQAEVKVLVEDKIILSKRPELALAYVADADALQDHFWDGLDGGSLPGFARVWETMNHLIGRQDSYPRDAVAYARKTEKQYQQIAESIIDDSLTKDLESLRGKFRKLLEE